MVAGAPFFFVAGEAEGVDDGVPPGSGDGLALAEGDGDSPGNSPGVGDDLRFFFLLEGVGEDSGEGLGDDFFFLAEADGLGLGVWAGVGLAGAFFFFGNGDFSGVGGAAFSAVAVGFGVGDFSAVDFVLVFLRGVGVGAKIFFSFVPNDSSAGARPAKVARIAMQARTAMPVRSGRMEPDSNTHRRRLLQRRRARPLPCFRQPRDETD
jgi:hypothetical protein